MHQRAHIASIVLFLFAGAVATLTARPAIAQDATPVADCQITTVAENEALVRAYFDAWSNRDLAALDLLLTEDHVHHWGIGHATEGRATYLDQLTAFLAAFPDLAYAEVASVFGAEDMVAARFVVTGTQSTDFQGFPASGVRATWSGINLFRFACGQIAEVWNTTDHLGRLMQQGAIPAPEATPAAT